MREVRVKRVVANLRTRAFEVSLTHKLEYEFPFARCDPPPAPRDSIVELFVDPELARMGFTYRLESGVEGCVLADQVLDYNSDPRYLTELVLYRLTAEALARLETQGMTKRQLARTMQTSPAQICRLLDTTYYRKSIEQMTRVLFHLGAELKVEVIDRLADAEVKGRPAA